MSSIERFAAFQRARIARERFEFFSIRIVHDSRPMFEIDFFSIFRPRAGEPIATITIGSFDSRRDLGLFGPLHRSIIPLTLIGNLKESTIK